MQQMPDGTRRSQGTLPRPKGLKTEAFKFARASLARAGVEPTGQGARSAGWRGSPERACIKVPEASQSMREHFEKSLILGAELSGGSVLARSQPSGLGALQRTLVHSPFRLCLEPAIVLKRLPCSCRDQSFSAHVGTPPL